MVRVVFFFADAVFRCSAWARITDVVEIPIVTIIGASSQAGATVTANC